MVNLTEAAKQVLQGKPVITEGEDIAEKADFFKKFEKNGKDKDDSDKDSKDSGDKGDDKDDDKGSKLKKCKKLVDADKDVKEDEVNEISKKTIGRYIKGANRSNAENNAKAWDKDEPFKNRMKAFHKVGKRSTNLNKAVDKMTKEEKDLNEVDTNNNPDRDAKEMKKFISQWKQLLKMDIGDTVAKGTEDGEITGVITDFVGYDDGEITDVVIEWDTKNEDGSKVEEIIPVKDIEVIKEDAKSDYKAKASHDRKVETNKKNREHGLKKEEEDLVEEKLDASKLLAKKKKDMKESNITEDETAAQDSLHPNTHPANDPKSGHDGPSRLALLTKMIGATHTMSDDECVAWLTKSLATIGHEADRDPSSAESNKATLKTYKPDVVVTGEDVAALFDGEELSEEFKMKTSVLFEAAVAAKMLVVENELHNAGALVLQEQMDENEEVLATTITELNEKVEAYLDYVSAQWMEENEIAVESAIRSEMTASFMKGLKDLFTEHYIDIPEDAVDIVEELSAKNDELESKLDSLIAEKHKLEGSIKEAFADELFLESSKGLATSQIEKFRVLAEDVEYTGDDKKYQEKLAFIREAHFKLGGTSKKVKVSLEDSFDAPEDLNEDVSPEMLPFVKAISRHVPRQIDPKKASG
jgi:hypothetical protein